MSLQSQEPPAAIFLISEDGIIRFIPE